MNHKEPGRILHHHGVQLAQECITLLGLKGRLRRLDELVSLRINVVHDVK